MKVLMRVVFLLLLFAYPVSAEVNWELLPAKKVQLFYPGTASWEYLVGKEHASAADAVVRGLKRCQDCHENEGVVNIRADEIVNGTLHMKNGSVPLEPVPPGRTPGLLEVEIQTAYDAGNLYLRFRWPSPEGASFKDPSLDDKGLADRVAIQLNGNIRAFAKAGCFITCHDDMANMPGSPADSELLAVPYYSKLNRKDVRHYAYYTRSNGWSGLKSNEDVERYLKAGGFVDLWTAGFKGQELVVSDESVLSDRIKDASRDISAQGIWQDGYYAVVITRKLMTADRMDIQLKEGKRFYIGLAIYDKRTGNRKHYVSFPLSVSIGGKNADLAAVKIAEDAPQAKEVF